MNNNPLHTMNSQQQQPTYISTQYQPPYAPQSHNLYPFMGTASNSQQIDTGPKQHEYDSSQFNLPQDQPQSSMQYMNNQMEGPMIINEQQQQHQPGGMQLNSENWSSMDYYCGNNKHTNTDTYKRTHANFHYLNSSVWLRNRVCQEFTAQRKIRMHNKFGR